MNPQYRTCNKCGWVHFAVTRKQAEKELAVFLEYFNGLSKETQESLYGGKPAVIRQYERCAVCGGPHTNFREYKPCDCPDGCTIGPIIYEERES